MPTVRKALAYVLGESCGQENHILPVNAMQYALSRRQLYTGGRDGLVKVWDCEPVNEPAEDAFLARDDVRSSLLGAGVSSADVDARVDNLSDSQVLQIHAQMNALPAGGDGVLGVIMLVIVIFMLLDVAGATDVFPGV